MHITPKQALQQLTENEKIKPDQHFLTLLSKSTGSVEVYRPVKVDNQQPHSRDEVYVIISGTGQFYNDGTTITFGPGDVLFVPAHKEHRFHDFSEDFATWVIFFGPDQGDD